MKVLNAISLNMLDPAATGFKIVDRLTVIEQDIGYNADGLDVVHWNHIESCIGHEDLCKVVHARYGVKIPFNRVSNTLSPGERVLVVQYKGPRLPEGSTKLPEGSTIDFLVVDVL